MKQQIRDLSSFLVNKKLYYLLLFIYFGFMTIPQWFRPFSPQYLGWLSALPFIVVALIVIGTWGIIGIWQTSRRKLLSNSKHIFFVRISAADLLWFAVAFALAYGTRFLYNHQKFNTEAGKTPIQQAMFPTS